MDRTIMVTGRGSLALRPDTARISIDASGVYPEYAETVRRSAEDTELIRKAVEASGLDPKSLKTMRFGVETAREGYQDDNGNWRERMIGYKYTHALRLELPNDNKLLGRVLGELSLCEAEAEFSISYTVKDQAAAKKQLLEKAVADSLEKAQVIADASGVGLGDIVLIDYSWGDRDIATPPIAHMRFGAPELAMSKNAAFDMAIEAEDIVIEDTVTVVREIK